MPLNLFVHVHAFQWLHWTISTPHKNGNFRVLKILSMLQQTTFMHVTWLKDCSISGVLYHTETFIF